MQLVRAALTYLGRTSLATAVLSLVALHAPLAQVSMTRSYAKHGTITVTEGGTDSAILHMVSGMSVHEILYGANARAITTVNPIAVRPRARAPVSALHGGGYTAQMPSITARGSGICTRPIYFQAPTAAMAATMTATFTQVLSPQMGQYPSCPSSAGTGAGPATGASRGSGGAAVAPPPAVVAATYWQSKGVNSLPTPTPRIAPGYALTGNPGYLETGATMSRSFTDATPLGPLSISATGRIYVNWGDGSGWMGPYADPGRPWPTGDITHVWADVGRYDVAVVEQWSATWSLAGSRGSLSNLRTQASIPAFDVRQLESVRNR